MSSAFKSVATALIIITMFILGYVFKNLKDNNSRDILVFLEGIYLIATVAIWI